MPVNVMEKVTNEQLLIALITEYIQWNNQSSCLKEQKEELFHIAPN